MQEQFLAPMSTVGKITDNRFGEQRRGKTIKFIGIGRGLLERRLKKFLLETIRTMNARAARQQTRKQRRIDDGQQEIHGSTDWREGIGEASSSDCMGSRGNTGDALQDQLRDRQAQARRQESQEALRLPGVERR